MPQAYQIYPANSTPPFWRSAATLDNLHLRDVPKPSPQPQTALVRIHAVSLNARDLQVISCSPFYPQPTITGLIPCSDGAGVVEAVGINSRWKVGDRVLLVQNGWLHGTDPQDFRMNEGLGGGDVDGTLRQYAVVSDSRLLPAPKNLSFEEAATLPTAGGTACNILCFGPKRIEKGMTVLTQGTGGVSCFAIQLASAVGATVFATSSSDEKLEIARQLGATHLINYRTHPNWAQEILRLNGGKGVDHVVEVGGAGTIEQSLQCLRQGGLISLCGNLTPSKEMDITRAIMFGAKTIRGVLGSGSKDMTTRLVQLVEEYNIHPRIAKIFEWKDAKEAFQYMLEPIEAGKVIIRVSTQN